MVKLANLNWALWIVNCIPIVCLVCHLILESFETGHIILTHSEKVVHNEYKVCFWEEFLNAQTFPMWFIVSWSVPSLDLPDLRVGCFLFQDWGVIHMDICRPDYMHVLTLHRRDLSALILFFFASPFPALRLSSSSRKCHQQDKQDGLYSESRGKWGHLYIEVDSFYSEIIAFKEKTRAVLSVFQETTPPRPPLLCFPPSSCLSLHSNEMQHWHLMNKILGWKIPPNTWGKRENEREPCTGFPLAALVTINFLVINPQEQMQH